MIGILDLKKSRTGLSAGRTTRGGAHYIMWHGQREPEILSINNIELAKFEDGKRYLIKEFEEVDE